MAELYFLFSASGELSWDEQQQHPSSLNVMAEQNGSAPQLLPISQPGIDIQLRDYVERSSTVPEHATQHHVPANVWCATEQQ